jgi:hypothetical protein
VPSASGMILVPLVACFADFQGPFLACSRRYVDEGLADRKAAWRPTFFGQQNLTGRFRPNTC